MSNQDPSAELDPPSPPPPLFSTERFIVAPLTPEKARELLAMLLQDERLASQVPWMQERSKDGALREAFLLEHQCNAGAMRAWGIVERERTLLIGTVLARRTVEGIDVEVLCASQFWNQGVADEAGEPVADWLEANTQAALGPVH